MAGCCKLYLLFMILMENMDFRVLPLGVLDGITEFSALSWVLSV
jgi:hypothetical protein